MYRSGGPWTDNPENLGTVIASRQERNQRNSAFFRDSFEQADEFARRNSDFDALRGVLAEALRTGASFAPGASLFSLESAITGRDAYNPSRSLSGGDRALAAAGSPGLNFAAALALAKAAQKANQFLANIRAGQSFERAIRVFVRDVEGIDIPALKTMLRAPRDSGVMGRTVPDLFLHVGNAGQILMAEMKFVRELSASRQLGQLEKQLNWLDANKNARYRLIVGPHSIVDKNLVRRIGDFKGRASIEVFENGRMRPYVSNQ